MALPWEMVGKTQIIQQYYGSTTLSDITICFGDKKIPAHKMILSMASDYFKNTFASRLPVPQELISNEFWMQGDDEAALTCLLRAMYGLSPWTTDWAGFDASQRIESILKLHEVSTKYRVFGVTEKTKILLKSCLQQCFQESRICEAIWAIYHVTPTHIVISRAAARDFCRDNIVVLMMMKNFVELVRKIPDLAVDVMASFAELQAAKRGREPEGNEERNTRPTFR